MIVKKRIIFISSMDFQGNSASANRVRFYSRALHKENVKSIYLQLGKSCSKRKVLLKIEEGVFGCEGDSKNLKYYHFFKSIKTLKAEKEFKTYFFLYPTTNIQFLLFIRFLQFFRILNFYVEVNEHREDVIKSLIDQKEKRLALGNLKNKLLYYFYRTNYHKGIYAKSLGLVCISRRIQKLYSQINKNTIRIPILADMTSSNNRPVKIKSIPFKICFAGTIAEEKEYLKNFILSVKELNKEGYNIVFDLYGHFIKNKDKSIYLNWFKENDCESFVNYKGIASNFELLDIYRNYHCLFLLRKKTKQNDYGFSTKLATYLASGTPILATQVSDMDIYMSEENCYYKFDHEPKGFSVKLKQVIDEYDLKSNSIAIKAKEVVLKNFDYRLYSKELDDFFFYIDVNHKKIRLL